MALLGNAFGKDHPILVLTALFGKAYARSLLGDGMGTLLYVLIKTYSNVPIPHRALGNFLAPGLLHHWTMAGVPGL
jgi:hypothetical protein